MMCVATGSETYADTYSQLVVQNVIEQLAGDGWHPITPPPGFIGLLGAVACPDPGYCISVSTLGSSPPDVIEMTNQMWSVGVGGNVTNEVANLTAVTCMRDRTCVAVGDQWLGGPADYIRPRATFIAVHTGQGWTVQSSPNL